MAGAAPASAADPDGPDSPALSVTVSFEDILEGRAYIRLPLVSKLLLCHWAGAPWADRNPKAHLHALQVETIAHREREQIVHGASRLGKSVLGGCRGLIATMLPHRKVGIVAARYEHVAHEFQYIYAGVRTLFYEKLQAFTRLKYVHQTNYHVYEIDPAWNTETRGYSTESDEGASLLGRELTDVILGEGSHISKDIREKRIQRAIDGALMNLMPGREDMGNLYIFTTPRGYEGCAAERYEAVRKLGKGDTSVLEYGKVPWPETCWIREADILENPAYDRRAFTAARKLMDKASFDEQYRGLMTFKTGRIYTEFDEMRHLVPPPPPEHIREMKFFVGIDTGAYFGAVLIGIDKQHVLWVLAETYTQKVKIDTSADELKEDIMAVLGPALGTDDWDHVRNRIERFVIDPASQHKLELIDLLELDTISTPTRGQGKFDLLPTVDIVRLLFKENRLLLSNDLSWTVDQLRKYIWKQTKTVGSKEPVIREPRKDYDHLMDALRFAAVPLAEDGPYEDAPPAATWVEEWENNRKSRFWGPLREQMDAAKRLGGI